MGVVHREEKGKKNIYFQLIEMGSKGILYRIMKHEECFVGIEIIEEILVFS